VRVAIATVQIPFIRGGAESLAEGLARALRDAGHEAEIVTQPFRFFPHQEVLRSMANWRAENFDDLNGYNPERVICLKFPTYYLQHHHKVVWLLHQHREVYDLWGSDSSHQNAEAGQLRRRITEQDTLCLSEAVKLRTISRNVTQRLKRFNGIASEPVYHPPPLADSLYTLPPEPYIFFPSRLETLKRQHLLIEAMRYVRSRVCALIAGEGGQRQTYERLVVQFGVGDRVRLLGRVSEEDLPTYYACSLGVFFGPRDEDYGYVTLEAMLSSKPVITCTDSGGPLEFVRDGETGFIVEPEPRAVAEAIEQLAANRKRAIEMGVAGREAYHEMNISWQKVVAELI